MVVSIFKALGDENRLRILNLLFEKDLCVCEIEVILELNQSNVSRNLRILRKNDFVETHKDAQWIHYALSSVFKENHAELVVYLEKVFKDNKIFIKDLERLNKYRDSRFDCQIIGEYRTKVLEVLE
jgi:ArsR family transcriptional regulator